MLVGFPVFLRGCVKGLVIVASPLFYARMGRKRIVILAALLAIAPMSSGAQELASEPTDGDNVGAMNRAGIAASSAFRQTRDGFTDAAMSPLVDLNLHREEIPPVLAMLDNPYDLPHAVGCYEIAAMIRDLDIVLGPDWDAPRGAKQNWDRQAADGVAGAALSAVSSEASGMIPFRGMVRKLSQAEKHARSYARAFKIGGQRRAFLKGVGHAKGCIGSAAPRWVTPAEGVQRLFRQIQLSAEKAKALEEKAKTQSAEASIESDEAQELEQVAQKLEAEAHRLEAEAKSLEDEAHRLEDKAQNLEAAAQLLEEEAKRLEEETPSEPTGP